MFIVKILIFGFILLAILAMIVLRFMSKGFRNFREVQEEMMNATGKRYNRQEYIKNQQEQREKNPFGSDYFKSSSKKKEKKEQKAQKESTTRRTTTSSGVTIIDDRDTEGKRKIFDHSDGEYVEFEEV